MAVLALAALWSASLAWQLAKRNRAVAMLGISMATIKHSILLTHQALKSNHKSQQLQDA